MMESDTAAAGATKVRLPLRVSPETKKAILSLAAVRDQDVATVLNDMSLTEAVAEYEKIRAKML